MKDKVQMKDKYALWMAQMWGKYVQRWAPSMLPCQVSHVYDNWRLIRNPCVYVKLVSLCLCSSKVKNYHDLDIDVIDVEWACIDCGG